MLVSLCYTFSNELQYPHIETPCVVLSVGQEELVPGTVPQSLVASSLVGGNDLRAPQSAALGGKPFCIASHHHGAHSSASSRQAG